MKYVMGLENSEEVFRGECLQRKASEVKLQVSLEEVYEPGQRSRT